MRLKNLISILIGMALLISFHLSAQSYAEFLKAERESYREYVKKDQEDFKAYRDQINAEYADMMRKRWEKHDAEPAVPQPEIPEPPEPVVAEPDAEYTSDPIPVKFVTPIPEEKTTVPPKPFILIPKKDKEETVESITTVEQEPVEPEPIIKQEPIAQVKAYKFSYYGTDCYIDINNLQKFKLDDIEESEVAKAWTILSSESYDVVVTDCLELRDNLKLSDWGYIGLVQRLTESFFGSNQINEARVMQMYILTQSGYRARIARCGEQIYVLLPFQAQVYDYKYVSIDGLQYYVITKESLDESFYVYNHNFPNEQSPSLHINNEPLLTQSKTVKRGIKSKKYPDVNVEVAVNKNLIDFYNDFPRNEGWELYSRASLSEQSKAAIYPALKGHIQDKTTLEAANILLNFVQTGFEYKTDEEQFGEERPFFADETLYYPYCDCEDRAILFSILVKDLLGIDIILLHYPGHLASAINIEEGTGDFIKLDGKKFVITDPTYIGARVGMTMPQFKKAQVSIIRL